VLADGRALAHFARMVAALGGPTDFVERSAAHLPAASVQRAVRATRSGWVGAMATREIGFVVVELGGGRRRADDAVDPRVGLSDVLPLGQQVEAGDRLATVHAATESSADAAASALLKWIAITDAAPAAVPVLIERFEEETPA
jgi:thymidine phosphorylase